MKVSKKERRRERAKKKRRDKGRKRGMREKLERRGEEGGGGELTAQFGDEQGWTPSSDLSLCCLFLS